MLIFWFIHWLNYLFTVFSFYMFKIVDFFSSMCNHWHIYFGDHHLVGRGGPLDARPYYTYIFFCSWWNFHWKLVISLFCTRNPTRFVPPDPRRLRIPMAPGIDSLNVGVSVGVVLHEALGAAVQAARTRKAKEKRCCLEDHPRFVAGNDWISAAKAWCKRQ